MSKCGSTVATSFGPQVLNQILQNGKNNLKYSGAALNGTTIYTYSDVPTNKLIPIIYNGETFYCQGTCACHCEGCYAEKMILGKNRKAISPSWARHTELMRNDLTAIYDGVCKRLDKTSSGIIRLYSSGDFLNQECIDMWSSVVRKYPHLSFFGYSKKANLLDLSSLFTENCNLVLGRIKGIDGKLRNNFGPLEEMKALSEATGAWLCPCELPENKGRHDICLNTCKVCLHRKDVVFSIH